ncbi:MULTISPECIES: helix-turn-helix transcriptional regulator [unclassified Agromyces]|uniref:helix-turn-helix transcriptional regulator n=1 Tax=unclassified Agromyces TaxID=2639701 RepID=UPI003015413E
MTGTQRGELSWRDIVRASPRDLRDRVLERTESDWSRDPAALLALAAAYREPGATNPYAAEPYVDAADALLANGDRRPELRILAAVVRAMPLRELGRLTEARSLLAGAADLLAAADLDFTTGVELRAQVLLHDGICTMLQGRLDEARHTLLRSLHLADARTPAHARAEAGGCIAFIDLRIGSLRSADAYLGQACAAAREAGTRHRLSTAPARLAEIAVAIERGAIDGLDARLAELIADTAGSEYEPLARAELATLHEGADDGVIDVLQELQLSVRDWEQPNLPRMLHDDSRIAFLVRRREAVAARAAIDGLGADATHSQCPATWRARLALDAGDPARAIELTDGCLAMGDGHSPRTAVRALLVAAAAHAALGDLRTADVLFAQSLSLAAPTGAVRAFAMLGPRRLAGLVNRARVEDHPAEVRRLLDAIAERYPVDGASAPDILSPRERIVLEHLVAGATQLGISSALSVSPNTVKTQVRSIYRKLGVRTRDGAVHRARTLGLIG